MHLKPPINGGAAYELRFQAHEAAPGEVKLLVGWIPIAGSVVPEVREARVLPGAAGRIAGQVPGAEQAFRMDIRITLSGGTPHGRLSLLLDGLVHFDDEVREEACWTSLVVVSMPRTS